MKYRKNEAKEAAREMLQGVWTALPTNFTEDDKVDEAAMAQNLEHCISTLKLEGHYCHGNVAEFWSMTNQERMRVHEINAEVTMLGSDYDQDMSYERPVDFVDSIPGLSPRERNLILKDNAARLLNL